MSRTTLDLEPGRKVAFKFTALMPMIYHRLMPESDFFAEIPKLTGATKSTDSERYEILLKSAYCGAYAALAEDNDPNPEEPNKAQKEFIEKYPTYKEWAASFSQFTLVRAYKQIIVAMVGESGRVYEKDKTGEETDGTAADVKPE